MLSMVIVAVTLASGIGASGSPFWAFALRSAKVTGAALNRNS